MAARDVDLGAWVEPSYPPALVPLAPWLAFKLCRTLSMLDGRDVLLSLLPAELSSVLRQDDTATGNPTFLMEIDAPAILLQRCIPYELPYVQLA